MADLPALGGDEFVYVFVPRPSAPDAVQPGPGFPDLDALPEDARPRGAYYTVRRRLGDGAIVLWVALHDGGDGVGRWARSAEPGDVVALWGPRRIHEPPADTTHHLLVCDETGLAACAALVDQLDQSALPGVATVLAELGDPGHRPAFPTPPSVDVCWVQPASTPGAALVDAVRAADFDAECTYAFGAGESRTMTRIRRHLRHEREMTAERVSMTAYWRAADSA